MTKIVDFKTHKILRQIPNERRIGGGLIENAEPVDENELAEDHTSEPIKSARVIELISQYLISMERYRDNMLFIVGINFGLRISDLLALRFSDLISSSGPDRSYMEFKDSFPVWEKKTRNTRKRKKNRYITINDSVIWAVVLYLENTPGVKLSDYMFTSESNNKKYKEGSNWYQGSHLTRQSVCRILKKINDDLGLGIKMSTHTLRKTFAYHQMLASHNDPRKLLLLQKILGHSSVEQTLDYIGITQDEIENAYRTLNLGGKATRFVGEMYEEDASAQKCEKLS